MSAGSDNTTFSPGWLSSSLSDAAMQPRHRRDETQAQAAPRLGPARLEPDEAAEHALALGARHAWSAIGDDDFRHGSPRLGGHAHFGLRSVAALGSIRRTVFDGIIDEIGNGLAKQLTIGAHMDGLDRLGPQYDPTFLGHRLERSFLSRRARRGATPPAGRRGA